MLKSGILIIICILCCHNTSFSQSDSFKTIESEEAITSKIREKSGDIKSIHCDFIQIKQMQYLDSDLKSSGKFWYVYPDKVRWEYLKPYEYIIILNKEKISLISTNSTNEFEVNSNETFKKMNEMIVSAVSGKVFDNSEYQTTILENKEFYKVVLQPGSHEIKQMIDQLELYFDKSNFAIMKLKIIEPSSDYSLIHFSNQILNEPISEHIFIP